MNKLFQHTEKLHYFYETALVGSIQATARKLGTTASTLSYAICHLEDVLATELFIRSRNGVTLTKTGKILYLFCKRFFRQLDDVCLAIKTKQQQPLSIRFATFSSIAIYFGPMLWRELQIDNSISLSIMTGRSKQVLELLVNNDIDLALTVETFKHPNLITHELYHDHYSFYISSKLTPQQVDHQFLAQHSLLYMPDASDWQGKNLATYIHDWHLNFKDYFELDSLEVTAQFTKEGLGIGLLPNNVAKIYGKRLTKITIPELPKKFGNHRFFLSYCDNIDIKQSVIDRILSLAQKAVRNLP